MLKVFRKGFAMLLLVFVFLPSCLAESQTIVFPQEFHTEINTWSPEDMISYIFEKTGKEPFYHQIYSSFETIAYENIVLNDTEFELIEFSGETTDPIKLSSVRFRILRPFGETIETSQFYIDVVNYFQEIYGREETDYTHSELWGGYPKLIWKNEENCISISLIYKNGEVAKGTSPHVDILFSGYIPTE